MVISLLSLLNALLHIWLIQHLGEDTLQPWDFLLHLDHKRPCWDFSWVLFGHANPHQHLFYFTEWIVQLEIFLYFNPCVRDGLLWICDVQNILEAFFRAFSYHSVHAHEAVFGHKEVRVYLWVILEQMSLHHQKPLVNQHPNLVKGYEILWFHLELVQLIGQIVFFDLGFLYVNVLGLSLIITFLLLLLIRNDKVKVFALVNELRTSIQAVLIN